MTATEMTIDSVKVALANYQRTLILKAKDAPKYLPVWIGACEADAVVNMLQDMPYPRLLTYDFLCAVIEALGAMVKSVVIDRLEDNTFYGKAVLTRDKDEINVDCRPSDAVAVAVRTKVPIFVDNEVLDRAAIDLEMDE